MPVVVLEVNGQTAPALLHIVRQLRCATVCVTLPSVVQGLEQAPDAPSAPSDCGNVNIDVEQSVDSSLVMQQAKMQHSLAQLLLVYQWTAALYRIWPSSIPDARSLALLSGSALSVAAELVV